MNFWDAVRNGIANYDRFRGRATRRELGLWSLAALAASALAALADGAISAPLLGFPPFSARAGHPLTVLIVLALVTPTLAVGARRLHDTGRRAAWLWLLLAPVIGWAALGWMLARPSTQGANRHGENVAGLYRT